MFTRLARAAAIATGSPRAFLAAVALIALWAASGPFLNFSDTWQLIANTATTLVTFLMVFLIQHQQNADTKALHVKMDEIIRALPDARNPVIDIESKDDAVVDALIDELRKEAT
jgi:low affinity Fe/Cu permease